MKIVYSPQFLRSFKKLSKDIQENFRLKESIFKNDPFGSRLQTHKLKGRDNWSFLITYKIRTIFIFQNNEIIFINIGDHSIYRK